MTKYSSTEIDRWREEVIAAVDLRDTQMLAGRSLRRAFERTLRELIQRKGRAMSSADRSDLVKAVLDRMVGYGQLQELLEDKHITEIMINGPKDIWVERRGKRGLERSHVQFDDEAQLAHVIDRIVSSVNRRVDESSPMVDARLERALDDEDATRERVNVILPPVSRTGQVVTIRRFPKPWPMAELVNNGTLSGTLARFLSRCVEQKLNVLVSGGTGSGKTTFLNALSAAIGANERIITIEDVAELQLQQQHVISLETRPPNAEGAGQVTVRDLVRNSLRMRPDRIIVGEVRGEETLDMLQAMNTGHDGSLATVHANSAHDAVIRLQTLAAMNDLKLTEANTRAQIRGAIDVFVHLARIPGPRADEPVDEATEEPNERRVEHVSTVPRGTGGEVAIELEPIAAYNPRHPEDPDPYRWTMPESDLERLLSRRRPLPPKADG